MNVVEDIDLKNIYLSIFLYLVRVLEGRPPIIESGPQACSYTGLEDLLM